MYQSRKRAAVACQHCRKRKRKCTGEKPTCSVCEAANVECNYCVETEATRAPQDPATAALSSRLDDIEVLLRQHSQLFSTLSASAGPLTPRPPMEARPSSSHVSPESIVDPPTTYLHDSPLSVSAAPVRPQSTQFSTLSYSAPFPSSVSEVDLPPMTIPQGHLTTTGSLLVSEKLKALLGDYPIDVFLETETRRLLPRSLMAAFRSDPRTVLPDMEMRITDPLVEAFFSSLHAENPILNADEFMTLYQGVLGNEPGSSLDSVLCLVCFALGEISQEMPNAADLANPEWVPGVEYISMALPVLIHEFVVSFGGNIMLPQALYLVARYFGFLARPLQSWRFVHMASTSLQHSSYTLGSMTPAFERSNQGQAIIRTAWAIFGLECDLIAEHHLPRSGIEHVIDSLPLPQCGQAAPTEILYWLAELSVRRLLNRVHHVVYMNETHSGASISNGQPYETPSLSAGRSLLSLLNVSAELDRQLETWLDLLPPTIKPDLADSSTWGLNQINVLCRYHSAKDIIFRPFLMYVCNLPAGSDVPNRVLEYCHKCLESCRAYLDLSRRRLRTPCSFGEIIVHSTFASAIVLTVASYCPLLADQVSDLEDLQVSAITTIQRLAFEGSCIESMLWILTAMRVKTKITRRVTNSFGI